MLRVCLKVFADGRPFRAVTKILLVVAVASRVQCFTNEFEKTEQFLDKINLEQSIAAVLQKVAYGSTTKRSIPDNAYPVTTLSTPLLTTYRYSDGSDEYLRVDVKSPENRDIPRSNFDYDQGGGGGSDGDGDGGGDGGIGYGSDLEKDHVLPTSAPAADILKNNNNKHYDNPNRYNNDRAKPHYDSYNPESATENVYKMTTTYNGLRNVRPTKSIYSKDVPSYVPPSRAFFTPPLPPDYLNPFADKPTLRGTNSDSFINRRPIPPPSLMPNKDRIPFRPDLPPSKVINMERGGGGGDNSNGGGRSPGSLDQHQQHPHQQNGRNQSAMEDKPKKHLNTPSQNVNIDRLGDFYGLNRQHNETSFEYEKGYIPSITRILSGSNGRHDDIPDILLRTVTATPNVQHKQERKHQQQPPQMPSPPQRTPPIQETKTPEVKETMDRGAGIIPAEEMTPPQQRPADRSESVTVKKETLEHAETNLNLDLTTQSSEFNLPNVKTKKNNVTKASSDEIWCIAWNVHVYLVVFCYIVLAIFSIYKLVRYENDPHMFSKSYFLTIHLMLTVICVLRIFYLTYDPYNVDRSFNIFLYDFLHNFPLSLLATTFAILILFLLKRTLTHLKVKTKPLFLVIFGLMHILLCFVVSVVETIGYFDKGGSLDVCKTVFVLLAWALGGSYLYLYRIIKNVLAKKSQNLSEMCTQNISYASHITIAVALLFILLGSVQIYALFCIKVDRFNSEIKHHWILWSFELSVRLIEVSIITLLAIVVSLKMSQREKQTTGFPLFPCTTSETSSDNMYPNNCNTNPNALNYSRQEMVLDSLPSAETIERPNLLKNAAFQNESFDKKSTLERYRPGSNSNNSNHSNNCEDFDRFERPKWGSERFERSCNNDPREQSSLSSFERNSNTASRNSARKYDAAKYYKPKYDMEQEYQKQHQHHHQQQQLDYVRGGDVCPSAGNNVYSEPIDQQQNQYERTRHEFERSDFDRRSRNSSNTSGRRSTTGRSRKNNHPRPHLGVQTLPNHERHPATTPPIGGIGGGGGTETMIVDDQGFVRFRHMQDLECNDRSKRHKKQNNEVNHYSDA